jgi:hypothetical protein
VTCQLCIRPSPLIRGGYCISGIFTSLVRTTIDRRACGVSQEEEKALKEGTNKALMFPILKLAGSGGLTLPQIMEKAKEGGVMDFNDKNRRHLCSVSFQPITSKMVVLLLLLVGISRFLLFINLCKTHKFSLTPILL